MNMRELCARILASKHSDDVGELVTQYAHCSALLDMAYNDLRESRAQQQLLESEVRLLKELLMFKDH